MDSAHCRRLAACWRSATLWKAEAIVTVARGGTVMLPGQVMSGGCRLLVWASVLFAINALAILGLQPAAAAGAKTVCGTRAGTAGNASLVNSRGCDVIVLAAQGGDQRLLDQADEPPAPTRKGGEAGARRTGAGTAWSCDTAWAATHSESSPQSACNAIRGRDGAGQRN